MTDDIAEAAAVHRRTVRGVREAIDKRTAHKATKHTIKDISFSPPMRVLCSCRWQVGATDAALLERLWKAHKSEVGEKHT